MGSSYHDVTVDVFDNKDEILEKYTDFELQEELERRDESDNHVEKERISLEMDFRFDLDNYIDEAVDCASDSVLIDELERRGYVVYPESKDPGEINERSQRGLALFLGLREWSTKEQILKEIEEII
jgi:hypothetical protein